MDEKMITDLGEQIKGVADDLTAVKAEAAEVAKVKAELAEQKGAHAVALKDIDQMASDVANMRAQLKDLYGKSGATDWKNEFGNFLKAVYHIQKNIPAPEWLSKAVDDYATDSDGAGGYLVPTLVGDAVNKLTLRHGFIFPKLNKVTIPAGVNVKMPWESTLASVAWRSTQGGSGTEIDPAIVWGNDTLNATWINGHAKISNEAMRAPGISIPDNIAMQLTAQIVRKIEQGVIIGDDSASAYPHDGLLIASSVNSQSALATPTLALVATFIAQCLADHEGSGDTMENSLITTDAVAFQLKSGASAAGLNAWGDPSTGVPPSLFGYELLTSPFAISTTNRLILSPLNKITVGWTGAFSVSFNESLGWTSNETWLQVSTHADYALGNPAMHHKAVVTALS